MVSTLSTLFIFLVASFFLKKFVESMNHQQEAVIQQETNKEALEELKEEMTETKITQEETKNKIRYYIYILIFLTVCFYINIYFYKELKIFLTIGIMLPVFMLSYIKFL
jgi:K+-sensing histidine kinase KdpD